MSDNVNIIVQDTINEIVVNSAVIVETIDINVQAAVDEVTIIANPNDYIINVNRIIGEQVQSDWNETDINAPDFIKNKPIIPDAQVNSDWNATSGVAEILNKPFIPTNTSDLINDGEDGINPFITLNDIPPVTGFVPYTGATQDVNLGEFGIQLGNLEFDTTPTNAPTGVGSMVWNDTAGTLDLKLKGGNVTLQIGQETVARVVNKTATNITLLEANYQIVRVTGAQGQRPKVDLALANNDLNSTTTLGLVTETIANNQEGFITTSGQVQGINTTGSLQGETWVDGDVLYLSGTVAGQATNIKPIAPIHTVIIGFVEHSHITQGKIFVKVDNGYELEELHNVSAIAPNNNEVLTYDSATLLWKPKTVSTALGYTPYNATNPNGYTSNLGTVTSVSALTLGTTGTDLSSTVANGTTTPVITLNVPTASATNRGALSSTDWTTFNGKFTLPTLTSGSVLFSNGTTITQDNSNFFWDNTNKRLGIGTNAPAQKLDILGTSIVATKIKSTTNTGATSYQAFNDINNSYEFGMWGSTRTVFGAISPDNAFLYGSTDLAITTLSNIKFGTGGGVVEKMRLNIAGNLLINTTVDQGGKLQVRAPGALSTDIALRIRNSADTLDIITIQGDGSLKIGQTSASVGSLIVTGQLGNAGNNSANFNSTNNNMSFNCGYYFQFRCTSDSNKILFGTAYDSPSATTFGYNERRYVVGASTMDTSAVLQADSTTKGFLPPRMTTTQRDAIATPATGLQVFNTTLGTYDIYNGTSWNRFGSQTLIKASGALSTDIALRVRNSADTTNLLDVKGDGSLLVSSTSASMLQFTTSQSYLRTNFTHSGGTGIFDFVGTTFSIPSNKLIIGASSGGGGGAISIKGFGATATTFGLSIQNSAALDILRTLDNGNILINTITDIASSKLTVESTTQGFLPPRMTTTQKNAITTPASGLVVYDTTLGKLCVRGAAAWETITSI